MSGSPKSAAPAANKVHRAASGEERTEQRRAVDPCSTHAHETTEIRAERTETSVTAEAAYRDWSSVAPSERPMAKHRAEHARMLFELLRDHATSRTWFAMVLGVNEKQVRKMLKGEAPIPSTVIACMPAEMRVDYLERLGALQPPSLADRFARLDLMGALEAQRQLTDRIAKLAQGSR